MVWYGRENIRAIITIPVAVGICEMRSGQDRFEFHLTLLPSLLDSCKKWARWGVIERLLNMRYYTCTIQYNTEHKTKHNKTNDITRHNLGKLNMTKLNETKQTVQCILYSIVGIQPSHWLALSLVKYCILFLIRDFTLLLSSSTYYHNHKYSSTSRFSHKYYTYSAFSDLR